MPSSRSPARPTPAAAGEPLPAGPAALAPPRARRERRAAAAVEGIPLDLALQGGGSHGAFTWGVLDRLLEDGRFSFSGVCGTSAGALNAGVLVTGWARGGAAGARAALRAFWLDVAGGRSCFGQAPAAAPASGWPWWPGGSVPGSLDVYNLDRNPWYRIATAWLQVLSPYQFNPLNLNALREVVARHVDPAALSDGPFPVHVVATPVATGRAEVFTGHRLSLDALLASACLPQLFQAVEIDGQAYWDGGYSGNPALWPLIYDTPSLDILIVKINPLRRERLPETPLEIADRVNEITFNTSLIGEVRAIRFVKELLAQGLLDPARYKDLRLHMVADEQGLAPLNPSSKLNTDRAFLEALHDLGRAAAQRWLDDGARLVGTASSLDLDATFLAP